MKRSSSSCSASCSSSSSSSTRPVKKNKYRGVRQRKWRRWGAEIHDGRAKRRLWLGSFDTAEEAAIAYDEAAVRIRGDKAITNFPQPPNPAPVGMVIVLPPPPQPEIKQEQK